MRLKFDFLSDPRMKFNHFIKYFKRVSMQSHFEALRSLDRSSWRAKGNGVTACCRVLPIARGPPSINEKMHTSGFQIREGLSRVPDR
jgi:hypothetical protein